MAPFSQMLEPPQNSGRFRLRLGKHYMRFAWLFVATDPANICIFQQYYWVREAQMPNDSVAKGVVLG